MCTGYAYQTKSTPDFWPGDWLDNITCPSGFECTNEISPDSNGKYGSKITGFVPESTNGTKNVNFPRDNKYAQCFMTKEKYNSCNTNPKGWYTKDCGGTPCGSCYGVPDRECCNSCEEVVEAYNSKGWNAIPNSKFAQCNLPGAE